MKKILILCLIILSCSACEKDIKTKALDILYDECIAKPDTDEQWCRCVKADLKRRINDEIALAVVQGRQHHFLPVTIFSARVICQCRLYPEETTAYGIPCNEMNKNNQFKF